MTVLRLKKKKIQGWVRGGEEILQNSNIKLWVTNTCLGRVMINSSITGLPFTQDSELVDLHGTISG